MDSLTFRNALFVVAGSGLASHLIFKRTETHEPSHLIVLLVLVPAFLSLVFFPHYASAFSAVGASLTVYFTSLLGSIIIYRLSPWHPLARYPGPVVARLTKFWFAFLSLRGKQYLYYQQLHDRYGDVVRVGPNELSIRDAAAIIPLMGPNGFPKGPFWDGRVPEGEEIRPMISLRDNTEHARRRRPWTRAFSTAALKGYESLITTRTNQLIEMLNNNVGTVDLSQLMSYFSYDFMTDLAFGGGSEMMRHGDQDGLWNLLEGGQRNAIFMSHVPWLGILFLKFPKMATDLKAFRAHAQNRAITRKKRGSPHKDLFHHLIDEEGVAVNPPTTVEVVSDGGLAIIAGSDTTSSAVSNLFYCLLTNPTKYKRLQDEIDELGDNVLDYGAQSRMSYLNASINEGLRLFSPVLSGSQRAPEPKSGGKMIGPYFIPEGTSAFMHFYSVQRDPRNFSPLPDSFHPERWLSEEDQLKYEPGLFKDRSNVIHNNTAFVPFSLGPSVCVGRNLAYLEMRMLVCALMHKFEVRFEESFRPKQYEEDMGDFFVMMRGKLPVVLTPRK